MINPEYVDGLEIWIQELTHERDELSAQLKTSRRDYEVMKKFREGAEAERDALAAHVERLKEIACRIETGMTLASKGHELVREVNKSPTVSLARLKARWQAEALGHVLAEVLTAVESDTVRAHLRNAMRKLRRQG